jgi:entry exclusion lipoprotein TrbK
MNKLTLLAAVLAALLVGCDSKPGPMPEVNDANCQLDKIMQIPDEATRREFGGRCSRRPVGPTSLPSKPKRW